MNDTTKFALLGQKLFQQCKASQATDDDIKHRISQLRRWNQRQFDPDYDFAHQAQDKEYIKHILAPIDLDIDYKTPATPRELRHFAKVCQLTRDVVNIEDLFTYDWRQKATVWIDPATKLQYLKVPKGAILYHGQALRYPFDTTRVPKYFSTLSTAFPYGFVGFKNNRAAERGKVVAFMLKEDILVLDITVVANWRILIPTKRSAPHEVIKAADECWYYDPDENREFISRQSSTECDNIVYKYLLSRPQASIATAAGSRSGGGMPDEIVFTDVAKLQSVGYELPYEFVMVNEFAYDEDADDNGEGGIDVDCGFVIEARANPGDRDFRLVATLSGRDFGASPYRPSPGPGKPTFEPRTPEQTQHLRQQCLQRAIGNFYIVETPANPVKRRKVTK